MFNCWLMIRRSPSGKLFVLSSKLEHFSMRLNMVKWILWKTWGEKRMTGNWWENFPFLFTVCIKASKTVGGGKKILLILSLNNGFTCCFFFTESVYVDTRCLEFSEKWLILFKTILASVTNLQSSKNEDRVSVLSRPGADKQAYRVLVMLKKKLLIDLACMRSHLFI